MKKAVLKCLLLVPAICAFCLRSQAVTLDIGTETSANWTVTGAGAVDATPFVVSRTVWLGQGLPSKAVTGLSLTSTGDSSGRFVIGARAKKFTGFWTADFRFFLPTDASNISLNFSNFYADDRAVMLLNGAAIGSTGIRQNGQGPDGFMMFTESGALLPYNFGQINGSASGSATTGFIAGGYNDLRIVINDTDNGICGPNSPLMSNDLTLFSVAGSVVYSPVPEPGTMSLGMIAGLCLLFRSRRVRPRAQ